MITESVLCLEQLDFDQLITYYGQLVTKFVKITALFKNEICACSET